MNEPPSPPPLPLPSSRVPDKPSALFPMAGGTGPGSAMEALLKHPTTALFEFTEGTRAGALSRSLILIIVAGLILFSLVAVDFSQGIQWWAAPLKLIGGLAIAALLCLPSLYIFSCLSGLEIRLKTVAGLLLTGLALTATILVGFAPVVWVFSQSSDSLVFMGSVMILVWSIALYFGLGLLARQARALGMQSGFHLSLWMIIFVLVTFQMTCTLRPLLGQADTFLPTQKRFFLQHWSEQINTSGQSTNPAPRTTPVAH